MLPGRVGNAQLGADAVRGADEDGLLRLVSGRSQVKEPAKATQVGIAPRSPRRFARRLNELHEGVACVDAYSRICVADSLLAFLLNGFDERRALKRLDLGFQ